MYFLKTNFRTQGGCVSYIKPEYLLDSNEFKCYLSENKQMDAEYVDGYKDARVKPAESAEISFDVFESVSKKAWLDSLLQLLKVCFPKLSFD